MTRKEPIKTKLLISPHCLVMYPSFNRNNQFPWNLVCTLWCHRSPKTCTLQFPTLSNEELRQLSWH